MLDTPHRIPWDFRSPDLASVRRKVSRVLKPFSLEAAATGPFDARICHRKLAAAELTLIEYGDAVVVDAGRMKNFYLLQIPLEGSYQISFDGERRRIGHGEVHLIHPDMWLRMEWASNCRLLVLRTADRRLLELERSQRRSAEHARGGYVFRCGSGAGASLGRIVDYLAEELTHGRLMAGGSALAAAAEQLLLGALLQALEQRRDASDAGSPDYVDRAEQYILDHLDSDLSIADIQRACGVNRRTLFYGFRAKHGSSPVAWARAQRLQRVRAELAGKAGRAEHISSVAMRWGFTHFGHFNEAYRRLFGETPSHTKGRYPLFDAVPNTKTGAD